MRSSSTGTAVRSTGISAPSARVGPPVYTGSSCTNRSLTTDGEITAACASAGTSYSPSYSSSTRTVSPSGTTSVTTPTGMPRMRTSEPG